MQALEPLEACEYLASMTDNTIANRRTRLALLQVVLGAVAPKSRRASMVVGRGLGSSVAGEGSSGSGGEAVATALVRLGLLPALVYTVRGSVGAEVETVEGVGTGAGAGAGVLNSASSDPLAISATDTLLVALGTHAGVRVMCVRCVGQGKG